MRQRTVQIVQLFYLFFLNFPQNQKIHKIFDHWQNYAIDSILNANVEKNEWTTSLKPSNYFVFI